MVDPLSTAAYAAAAIAVAESTRKIIVNRPLAHDLSRDYIALGLALIAVSLAAGAPATMSWTDRHSGVYNLGFALHCLAAMAAMVCAAGFLRTVGVTVVRVRVAMALFGGCVLTLTALYLIRGTADPDFGASSNRHPASVSFTLIYLAYMASWLTLFIRGAWKASRGMDRVVQLGVFLSTVGVTTGLLGLAWKLVVLVESLLQPPGHLLGTHFAFIAQVAGAVMFAAGSGFAAVVSSVHDRRDRARVQAISRLWWRLEPVLQESALLQDDAEPDLDQQVVQIFDAWLVLRAYVHPWLRPLIATDVARHRLRERRADLVRAAAELRAALVVYEQGCDVPNPAICTDPGPQHALVTADEREELAWLAAVSNAWDDPAVDEVLRRAEARVNACGERR